MFTTFRAASPQISGHALGAVRAPKGGVLASTCAKVRLSWFSFWAVYYSGVELRG